MFRRLTMSRLEALEPDAGVALDRARIVNVVAIYEVSRGLDEQHLRLIAPLLTAAPDPARVEITPRIRGARGEIPVKPDPYMPGRYSGSPVEFTVPPAERSAGACGWSRRRYSPPTV